MFLLRIVRSLFPSLSISSNARGAHGLKGEKGAPLEIDVYLPQIHLGFEYQDPHHYFDRHYGTYTLSEDKRKHLLAEDKGITIISIPFWWEWNTESLIATIKKERPELLQNMKTDKAFPISHDIPPEIMEKWHYDVPGLGLPMLALAFPQLKDFDPTGWLIFEKYDGARAIWNADEGALYSRWGTPLSLPNYITSTFPPKIWLDGELWFGRERGRRYFATTIATAHESKVQWGTFQYMVFDTPQPRLRDQVYTIRHSFLLDYLPKGHPYIQLAPYEICESRDDIERVFFKIRGEGGEGIILRQPNSKYVQGYSRFLYKHKGFQDAEALVISKKSDKVFTCKMAKQHLIHNASDLEDSEEIDNMNKFFYLDIPIDESFDGDVSDIKEGTFVSFRYVAGTSPKNAKFDKDNIYSIRNDIHNWAQVLQSKRKPPPVERVWKPKMNINDWTKPENQRKFMEDFANSQGFDPLIVENWYSVSRNEISSKAKGLFAVHNYSFLEVLQATFPELTFDGQQFEFAPKSYWKNKENRKKLFLDIAASKKMDPQVASNWYALSKDDFNINKMYTVLNSYYNGSVIAALKDLFPFIGLDETKFSFLSKGTVGDKKFWKSFFDGVAETKQFDPLNPINWYNITPAEISEYKNGTSVLYHFKGSLVKALMATYPDIGLESTNFNHVESMAVVRKAIFDNYAKNVNFDPLNPENWYMVATKDFNQFKKAKSLVFGYYSGSFISGLLDVYPNIGLDPVKFKNAPRNQWANIETHKKFFLNIAKEKDFDPLQAENWYSVSNSDVTSRKGARNIVVYHSGSIVKALQASFPLVNFDVSRLQL